jgi:hypothetical protein
VGDVSRMHWLNDLFVLIMIILSLNLPLTSHGNLSFYGSFKY